MAANTNAGQIGSDVTLAVAMANEENKAPADRKAYNPATVSTTIPGAAARANGYPRAG